MYKSCRIINGRPKWVIVDDDGKVINKEPNVEELRSAQKEKYKFKTGVYNSTNSCQNCGDKLIPHINAFRERDKNEKLTGRWLCKICMEINRYRNRMKPRTHCRTNSQDPNQPRSKGYIFEELTCRWRGVKNLNIENDNYNVQIDHDSDPELGVIQTKGRTLRRRRWSFNSLERERYKIFDHISTIALWMATVRLWKAQDRPFLHFEGVPDNNKGYGLKITNVGKGPAFDIRFRINGVYYNWRVLAPNKETSFYGLCIIKEGVTVDEINKKGINTITDISYRDINGDIIKQESTNMLFTIEIVR